MERDKGNKNRESKKETSDKWQAVWAFRYIANIQMFFIEMI